MIDNYKNLDALVLMSGGQDSTTSLFWAMKEFRSVNCITFFYDQKHSKEVEISKKICRDLNISQKIVDISFIKDISVSNLFNNNEDVSLKHPFNENVPSSFVPYRNLLFLTIAAAWASTLKINDIIIGVSETDYSGYADCRDIFIKSTEVSLNLATDFKNLKIHTPLMWLTKAQEFILAEKLGCFDFIINETLTCYNGVENMNDFGKGCGECPSCILRKNGYKEYIDIKNK